MTALSRIVPSVVLTVVVALLLLAPLPAAAQRDARHPSLQAADLPALIPLQDFFADKTSRWDYRISPDGRKLVWIDRDSGTPAIVVKWLDTGEVRRISAERPIYTAYWAYDSRRLVFYWDDRGDENYQLHTVDIDRPDAPPRNLTPFPGVKVRWQQGFPDDPAHMLVRLNRRDPALHDLYRLNIDDGSLTLLAENPGDVRYWVTDAQGDIIARFRTLADGAWVLEVPTAEADAWRRLKRGAYDDSLRTVGHSIDGKYVWALSALERDKKALVRLDLDSGVETVVHSHPDVDVERAWIDRYTYQPLRAQAWPGYLEVKHFDADLAKDMALFQRDGPANVRIESADRAKRKMTLVVDSDRGGRAYYLLDRDSKEIELLAEPPVARYREQLSETRPIRFAARDGLSLNGYLTVPKGTDGQRLPMVLRVHGGPWWRDYWGYSALNQFLANRGYAVLQINYRGSLGYGRAHLRAAKREFAGKMHDDLIDGVNWAIAEGIADPDRVAIYGRSYGGYATMVGMTFTPEVFAAGVNIVGLTDLIHAMETFPPYWRPYIHQWRAYVGDPAVAADRADMAARSPINRVEQIKRPLLIAHGANDVRVVRSHSDRIVAAMQEAGLPVEYIVFDDEGHAIRKWQNQMTLNRAVERFLAEHLGGRAEAAE